MSAHLEPIYNAYREQPSPESLHAVVHALKPTIDYTLASLQSAQDPVLRSKAHVLAAQAIQRFDPANGAQLHTWVSSQLMPLRRMRRQNLTTVKMPERVQLDAYTLHRAEQEFMDKHQREPDVEELSDHAKIPIRRINIIRNTMRRTPTEGAIGDSAPPESSDFMAEALEYVHKESDHIDRKIIEHKLGYGGAEMLAPNIIAAKLKLTPTQLTRRSQRLTYKLQQIERNLQKIQ